jgi:hypothetical protein
MGVFGRLKALMVVHVILLGPIKLGLGCPRGYEGEDWRTWSLLEEAENEDCTLSFQR